MKQVELKNLREYGIELFMNYAEIIQLEIDENYLTSEDPNAPRFLSYVKTTEPIKVAGDFLPIGSLILLNTVDCSYPYILPEETIKFRPKSETIVYAFTS